MRRYFAVLLAFIVAVFAGVKIAQDPGYVTFYYQYTSVTMPLWLCVLATIVMFIVFATLLRVLDSSRYLVQKWRHWRLNRRYARLQKKSQQGLLTLVEGQFQLAEKQLRATFQLPHTPIVNYLSAALAAHEQGAFDRRDAYLRKASRRDPDAAIPIAIAKAQWQLEQEAWEGAAETLDYLKRVAPRHPRVMLLLKTLYEKTGAWESLLNCLPFLVRHRALSASEAQEWTVRIYSEQLRMLDHKKPETIIRFFEHLPRILRMHPTLVGIYAEQLILAGCDDVAEKIIVRVLAKQWDIHLVRLYGLAHSTYPLQQFKHIEQWLSFHPHDPELLLVAGQVAMRVQLWGKARVYLEASIKQSPRAMTYQSLGKLYEQLGEKEKALAVYRQGMGVIVE